VKSEGPIVIPGSAKGLEVTSKRDVVGVGEEEISFKNGDVLVITDWDSSGWLEGFLKDGDASKSGWFPGDAVIIPEDMKQLIGKEKRKKNR